MHLIKELFDFNQIKSFPYPSLTYRNNDDVFIQYNTSFNIEKNVECDVQITKMTKEVIDTNDINLEHNDDLWCLDFGINSGKSNYSGANKNDKDNTSHQTYIQMLKTLIEISNDFIKSHQPNQFAIRKKSTPGRGKIDPKFEDQRYRMYDILAQKNVPAGYRLTKDNNQNIIFQKS